MPPENTKKYNPPYISPRSFYHLLERLQENIPGRIDRSYLDTMFSGSASTQVMAAMRFMNLVDMNNKPTHHLRLLVDSREEERTKRLKDLCNNSYTVVFTNGSVDPQTATYAQLEELFQYQYGVDGDVRRKCIKFFTSIATDAGIPLSSYITNKVRTSHANNVPRAPVKKVVVKPVKPSPEVPLMEKVPENNPLLAQLLAKFPAWEPSWTDEQKSKWLEGFNQFMQKIYPELKK
ncbi:MAG: DUF5343 domain-containing protein [Dehalococcoidales bacterium]|nr:DUF5343 domain-containing protein [Dehalococcoidales bacterium]